MPINKLAHISIRTAMLDTSIRFYCDILGFREGFRPPFQFPGVWLYRGGDEQEYGSIHLIGIDKDDPFGLTEYLGDKTEDALIGSGAVDHIAFLATNLGDMQQRLNDAGIEFRERTVPSLGLHQLFVEDPSGITIELNYPAAEAEAFHGPAADNLLAESEKP